MAYIFFSPNQFLTDPAFFAQEFAKIKKHHPSDWHGQFFSQALYFPKIEERVEFYEDTKAMLTYMAQTQQLSFEDIASLQKSYQSYLIQHGNDAFDIVIKNGNKLALEVDWQTTPEAAEDLKKRNEVFHELSQKISIVIHDLFSYSFVVELEKILLDKEVAMVSSINIGYVNSPVEKTDKSKKQSKI